MQLSNKNENSVRRSPRQSMASKKEETTNRRIQVQVIMVSTSTQTCNEPTVKVQSEKLLREVTPKVEAKILNRGDVFSFSGEFQEV